MTKTKSTYLALVAVLLSPIAANADLIGYDLEWSGSESGYYGTGMFSFDEADVGDDHLIMAGDLASFMFTVFDDLDYQLWTWNLTNQGSMFSFNFETDTETVREGPAGGGSFPSELAWLFINVGNSPPVIGGYTFCGDYVAFNFGSVTCANLEFITGGTLVATAKVSVPEPGTLALFGIGLAGMGLARRRKKF